MPVFESAPCDARRGELNKTTFSRLSFRLSEFQAYQPA